MATNDQDPATGERLKPARGVFLAVMDGLLFWAGFFFCAYLCLSRPRADDLGDLNRLNRTVNWAHAYVPGVYDCKNFTVAKYRALVTRGVDRSRLHVMAMNVRGVDQTHMLLVVDTDHGQVAMDSLDPWTYDWSRAGEHGYYDVRELDPDEVRFFVDWLR